MKLLIKSEINKTKNQQNISTVQQGLRYATIIDKEIKKLNSLKDEYEKEKNRINKELDELFIRYQKLLHEVQKLEYKKKKLAV